MLQRLIVAFVAVICIAMGSAMAQPKPVDAVARVQP